MQLIHTNGHAALQAVQPRLAPPRAVELQVDLGRPTTLARNSRPAGGGAEPAPSVPTTIPAPAPADPGAPAGKGKGSKPARRKAPVAPQGPAVAQHQGKSSRRATSGKPGRQSQEKPQAGEGTKKALVLALLRRSQGATLAELQQATGWQSHSVRGYLSGADHTKMGLKVRSGKRADGVRVYSIRG